MSIFDTTLKIDEENKSLIIEDFSTTLTIDGEKDNIFFEIDSDQGNHSVHLKQEYLKQIIDFLQTKII